VACHEGVGIATTEGGRGIGDFHMGLGLGGRASGAAIKRDCTRAGRRSTWMSSGVEGGTGIDYLGGG